MIAGVVLAGGRSRRMGTPKAMLDWHGKPLVCHAAVELRDALGGAPLVVVHAPGQELPELPDGIETAVDRAEGRGPLEGLLAGLAALEGRADAAVVAATDQPFAARIVPRLIDAFRDTDEALAFEGSPLGAIYRPRLRPIVQARLATGDDHSLRGLLAAVDARALAPDAKVADALRSLDTPDAYEAALRP